MLVGNYELFCKDFHLCEGYEKALNTSEKYFLHHIQGEKIPREELIENDLYYDCEPENLRWVTRSEHGEIHLKGEKNPNFGNKYSDETRRKMSEAKKGENHPLFGKTRSDETRKKMSEAHKGKILSDETRRKMSEAAKGTVHSAETRRKISEAKKGRTSPNKGKSWKLVNGKRIWYKKISY